MRGVRIVLLGACACGLLACNSEGQGLATNNNNGVYLDSAVPPDGSQVHPDGALIPPDGSQVHPDGALIPPDGGQTPLDGSQPPPDAAQLPPDGGQTPLDSGVHPVDGITGDACGSASQCGGITNGTPECMTVLLTVLQFPDGYCSSYSCTEGDSCDDGTGICVSLASFVNVCLKACTSSTECRQSSGYTCTTIPYVGGIETYCLEGGGTSPDAGFLGDSGFPFGDGGFP